MSDGLPPPPPPPDPPGATPVPPSWSPAAPTAPTGTAPTTESTGEAWVGAVPPGAATYRQALAPGEMTGAWRIALAGAWVAALFAYAAVWQAGVQLGIGTWWVGPRSQPTSPLVKMVPFAIVIAAILPVAYNFRNPHRIALTLSAAAALVAVPDFSRSTGLAIVELVIAAALALVSAMAATGVARVRPPRSAG